jgi:hypothetical protein
MSPVTELRPGRVLLVLLRLYTKHSISILGNGIGRDLRIRTAGENYLEPGNLTYLVKLTTRLIADRPSAGAWRQRAG